MIRKIYLLIQRTYNSLLKDVLSLDPRPVWILALIAGAAAFWYSYSNDLFFSYLDAIKRLDISRRIFDSQTPGILKMMGTVWLPVSTLLNVPFVYFDWLWYTGIGPALQNLILYVLNAVTIFLLIREITKRTAIVWFGTLLFVLNSNILYFQTTGMSENLFLFELTLAVFLLMRWHKTGDGEHLFFAGLVTALMAGTRYEGWVFAILGFIFIAFYCFLNKEKYIFNLFSYSISSIAFVVFWLAYNQIFYGDYLAFQRGQFSSENIAGWMADQGGLFAKGNFHLSLKTAVDTVKMNASMLVFVLMFIGIPLYALPGNLRKNTLFPLLLLSTFPLTILSLYEGQIFIFTPMSDPSGYLNTRYGLYLLPAACFFSAYLLNAVFKYFRFNGYVSVIVCGILMFFYLDYNYSSFPLNSPAYYEAANLKNGNLNYYRISRLLEKNYSGGKVLIGDWEIIIYPDSQLDMEERIDVFSNENMHEVMNEYGKEVKWAIFRKDPGDKVINGASLDVFLHRYGNQFVFIYSDQDIEVYKRKS